MAFTRQEWNEIIDAVNDVITNPPEDTDCEPLDPIPHVGEKHKWSKGDIQTLHEAIEATCEDIDFDDVPEKWKQSIVDEINTKLGETWCDCEDDCDTTEAVAEDGFLFKLFTLVGQAYSVYESCGLAPLDPNDIDICDMVNGLSVATPGFTNRTWSLVFIYEGGSIEHAVAGGDIDEDGFAVCETNITVDPNWGPVVTCDCDGPWPFGVWCRDGNVPTAKKNVSLYPDKTYHVRVNSANAECVEDQ